MKYSLVIQFLLIQLFAFGQESACLLSKKSIFKGNVLTYEQKNTFNTKRQLIQKQERLLGVNTPNYTLSEQYVYDKNENVVETTNYVNGEFRKSIFQKFNEQNQLVEEAIITSESDKKKITKTAILNELRFLNDDGSFTKILSENDSKGNLTKEITFGLDGKATNESTFSYNERGDLVEKSAIELFRNKTSTTVFERNETGAIREEITTINDEPFRKIVNSLNPNGNIIEKRAYNKLNQLDYVIIYTYDTAENVTSESYFSNEELITKSENTYDTNGNLTLQRNFDRSKLVSTITYEYICP